MTNIEKAAAAFERLDLHTHDPKWSSWVMERLLEELMSKSAVSMTDLFMGFDLALKRNAVRLTETVANLIKDTVVTSFTEHKSAYRQAEWGWAAEELSSGVSAPQAYFFLHALPPDKATATAIVGILRGLEGSSRFDEAVATLSDDFDRPEVLEALQRWRANGMTPQGVAKFQSVLTAPSAS